MSTLMNTREVAQYLRLKERKIYDLVATGLIPCTRLTGKWLFPKALIDLWVLQNTEFKPELKAGINLPRVIAGSHDPLLEWAVRESDCELALLFEGSLDGLTRLTNREALACGVHVFNPASGQYNVELVHQALAGFGVVALEWAWREQGLIVAAGNPCGIAGLAELTNPKIRFVDRQQEAGSHLLMAHLVAAQGLSLAEITIVAPPVRSETEVALAVFEGRADAGFGIAAVARQFRLDFVPLHRERYDLVIGRRDYFEPPFQTLLAFTASTRFREKATALGGYTIANLGRIVYNAP